MFNDQYQLTQLVLEGYKTMTRRAESGVRIHEATNEAVQLALELHKSCRAGKTIIKADDVSRIEICTRYLIGEEVAIAQSYNTILEKEYLSPEREKQIRELVENRHPGATNKMYVSPELMPHSIRITDIRIERQQDISDEDCMAEGIRLVLDDKFYYFEGFEEDIKECPCGNYFNTPKEAFAGLVEKAMGKGIWEKNPWVVVYEFELII